MKVWVMIWVNGEGANSLGGVYSSREKALYYVINYWFEETEVEEDRYSTDTMTHIYTNCGEYIIQQCLIN